MPRIDEEIQEMLETVERAAGVTFGNFTENEAGDLMFDVTGRTTS